MWTRTLMCTAALWIFTASIAGALPLGSEFTYQGTLAIAGSPAIGAYDFRFLLYDAEVGGSQVGSIVLIEDLAVTAGRVTTPLDFGDVFDGSAFWLEVHVRDGASTGGYTVLNPRQGLTAAPYARHAIEAATAATAAHATTADSATNAGHSTTADSATTAGSATSAGHASTADSATSAGDAGLLDGQDGAYYLSWGNLTGVPNGLDDGDTLDGLSCSEGEIAKWTGSAWQCRSDDGVGYGRTYFVGPVGTAAENGAALLAALEAIPTPAAQAEGAMLKIEPGLYDLGTATLTMKDWVDVEGSGRDVSKITSSVCGTSTGTVVGAWYAELRYLTVENLCASAQASAAVYNNSGGFRMTHLDVLAGAPGSDSYGVDNSGDWSSITDVTISVQGETPFGLRNRGGNSVTIRGVSVTASGSLTSTGLSSWTYEGVRISEINVSAGGGSSSNIGVTLRGDDVVLRDAVVEVSGTGSGIYVWPEGVIDVGEVFVTAETGISVWNMDTTNSANMRQVTVRGSATGISIEEDSGDVTVRCDGCVIDASVNTITNVGSAATVFIGGSQMGPSGVSGDVICAGSYSNTMAFVAGPGCP